MKTRILIVTTIVACAILWGGNAFSTKLAVPAQSKPTADLATPSSELAKPSADLARPSADLTRPDATKPTSDRIKPGFQRPMRELMPMPISNRTTNDGPGRTIDNEKPVRLKQK